MVAVDKYLYACTRMHNPDPHHKLTVHIHTQVHGYIRISQDAPCEHALKS